jgi:F0F1-type ATP synthase membrane subunit c/vacuolar-type H+-ATPase subunit K
MAISSGLKSGLAIGTVGAIGGLATGASLNDSRADQSSGMDMTTAGVFMGAGVGAIGASYGVGHVLTKSAESAYKNREAIIKKGYEALQDTGDVALTVGKGAKEAGRTMLDAFVGGSKKIGDVLVDFDKNLVGSAERPLGLKFTKKGKMIGAAVTAGAAILGANRAYDNSRVGRPDGVVVPTPTMEGPSMDNYQDRMAESYGAGGDLVFALHKNRRGRF